MAPSGKDYKFLDKDGDDYYHQHRRDQPFSRFANPPLTCRPKLFCCPVAESSQHHLPRSFVNPGRHLMNQQLRTFLECADDDDYTFHKCEVSHMVEVTTRALCNDLATLPRGVQAQEQWNRLASPLCKSVVDNITPPLECEDSKMSIDQETVPYSTYQSMSTRCFITQNSSNSWQVPPHSRQYRDNHPDPNNGRIGAEKYIEVPPLRTVPYTSESASGNGGGAREWIPSCSILIWCNKHNTFYEVHILS